MLLGTVLMDSLGFIVEVLSEGKTDSSRPIRSPVRPMVGNRAVAQARSVLMNLLLLAEPLLTNPVYLNRDRVFLSPNPAYPSLSLF